MRPKAQGAALALVEAAGELCQIGLAARGLAPHGQEKEGRQTEEGIGFHSRTICGQGFEVIDAGADFLDPFGAAARNPARLSLILHANWN